MRICGIADRNLKKFLDVETLFLFSPVKLEMKHNENHTAHQPPTVQNDMIRVYATVHQEVDYTPNASSRLMSIITRNQNILENVYTCPPGGHCRKAIYKDHGCIIIFFLKKEKNSFFG